MEVSMRLTDRAIRILKSYATLSGKDIKEICDEMGDLVSAAVERELAPKIAAELDLPSVTKSKAQVIEDTTGISDGLGDEDTEPEEPEGSTEEDAMVPTEGGLTDEVLAKDMEVDNPETEVKVEAPATEVNGEDLFAQVAGFDQWGARRKQPRAKVGKGKVTPMTGDEETRI